MARRRPRKCSTRARIRGRSAACMMPANTIKERAVYQRFRRNEAYAQIVLVGQASVANPRALFFRGSGTVSRQQSGLGRLAARDAERNHASCLARTRRTSLRRPGHQFCCPNLLGTVCSPNGIQPADVKLHDQDMMSSGASLSASMSSPSSMSSDQRFVLDHREHVIRYDGR